jgi:hypothetical protein
MSSSPRLGLVLLLTLAACGGGSGGGYSGAGAPPPGPGGAGGEGGTGAGEGGSSSTPDDEFGGDFVLEIPVQAEEALSSGQAGVTRLASVATFGFPLAESAAVAVDPTTQRPALAVQGSGRWQFETLEAWPDGSAKWVLVDLLTDVAAGQPSALLVTEGAGVSAGDDLAEELSDEDGDSIQVDTGPMQVVLSADAFDLFESVTVDGQQLVEPSAASGLYGTSFAGDLLLPGDDTSVTIERNGPACAVVKASGSLVDPTDTAHCWFTCRLTFRAASRDVEVSFTARNASITQQAHVQIGALELALDLAPGANPAVTATTHAGEPNFNQLLGASEECVYYVGQTTGIVADLTSSQYQPHIPRQGGVGVELEDQGYELSVDGNVIHAMGDKTEYAGKPWLDLTGEDGGVTVAIQRLAQMWPGALEATGDGRVTVGVFTARNDDGYTFLWQQHESRTAVFSFHRVSPADPGQAAVKLDHPLTGRVPDYTYYRDVDVFAYKLVTEEQTEQVLTALGITHTVTPNNISPSVTRYLFSHQTGGPNNFPSVQTSLAAEWLRSGRGGHYLQALDLALYKSEWQIRRSDDFVDDGDDPISASNPSLPHTTGTDGDDEHRYREGIILAYYLTGDPRYRDAIFDEAEVLRGVDVWEHERSMYRTLVAMAHVIEFTGDDDLRDNSLIPRLQYITQAGPIDACSDPGGFGWSGAVIDPIQYSALTPDVAEADRRYYVFSGDLGGEKEPGENFQARGFITASFGPIGYYHAARALDPNVPAQQPMHDAARGRMRDLAFWTYNELYYYEGNTAPGDPDDFRLVYSYGVCAEHVGGIDNIDFHPILIGMTEMYEDLKAVDNPLALSFLDTGAQQIKAAKLHNHLHYLLQRLDCQHFFATWLEVYGGL